MLAGRCRRRGTAMTRSGRTKAGLAVMALGLPLSLLACSSSTPEVSTAPTTAPTTAAAPVNQGASVVIKEFEYLPGDVTVKANQTVRWSNEGSAKHTVTADKGQAIDFKSPTLVKGEGTFDQSFGTPGTYKYFCSVHPDKMKGTITVTP